MAISKIKTNSIANDAITSDKLATGGIATVDMADGSVTSLKIAAGAVDTVDIANDAITTAKILNANVTSGKLASGVAVSNIGYTPLNKAGDTMTGSLLLPGGDGSIQRSGGNTWLMLSSNAGYGSGGVHLKLDNSSAAGGFYFFSQSASILEMAGAGKTLVLQGGSTSAGTGIAFPSSQTASADANTLDDYEEGTWTPNIDSNNGAGTFGSRVGSYVKIGKQVTIWFVCDGGSSLAGGSTQYLTGLPFTIGSINNTTTLGHMGSNGPAIRSHQLMTLSGNRSVMYIYNGGSQETTTISFASGNATYWIN